MKLKLTDIPVVYINLDEATEKGERVQKSLEQLGFKNIIRFSAHKETIGKKGCAISHVYALEEVEPPFLLIEDDCLPKEFVDEIEFPDDADAVYLGISSWGRMNSHSGPFVQYGEVEEHPHLLRIYNMLSTHAILYLNSDYIDLCRRIAYQSYLIADHLDIGFAEVQRYYDIYAYDNPLFYQTSSNGTDKPLSSYPTEECFNYNKHYFLPQSIL
tara:strand:+ start:2868 stop:3509 length:642 start_codon:yes stop_codon:yes gene_type:complete